MESWRLATEDSPAGIHERRRDCIIDGIETGAASKRDVVETVWVNPGVVLSGTDL